MIVLKCKDSIPDCVMDNMCCNFCTRDKLDCDGCDEDCLTCGCAIPENEQDEKYLRGIDEEETSNGKPCKD